MVALNSSMLPLGSQLIPFMLENFNPRYSEQNISVSNNHEAAGHLGGRRRCAKRFRQRRFHRRSDGRVGMIPGPSPE